VNAGSQTCGYVLAVTGLRAEARVAERSPQTQAVAGGGDAVRLDRLIENAINANCHGVISFGMAAGLKGNLVPGTCLIGREIAYGSERISADEEWAARLKARLGNADLVVIAGVDKPLIDPSQKRALYEATGAAAADMESHVAARVAAGRRLPFAAVRIVADPADRALPPAALAGMRADGRTNPAQVLLSLGRDPRQIPQLVRVAADAFRAYSALLRCHRRLGSGLGLIDLS
jgi:hopanoid-associated phosphorylase